MIELRSIQSPPTNKVHRHAVKGRWVGKRVADILPEMWTSVPPAASDRATDASPYDITLREIEQAADEGRITVERQALKTPRADGDTAAAALAAVLATGRGALAHILNLRECIRVQVLIREPAMLDTGPLRVVSLLDISALIPDADDSRASGMTHLVFAVDKPATIPVHPGGLYMIHTVIGQLATGRFTDDTAAVWRVSSSDDNEGTERRWQALEDEERSRRVLRFRECCTHLRGSLLDSNDARLSPCTSDFYPRPVHRLDRGTSGVNLFATSTEAAALVSAMFAADDDTPSRTKAKQYVALLRGRLDSAVTCDASLPLASADGRQKPASTQFAPIRRVHVPGQPEMTLAQCVLLRSGRTHQVRQHAAAIGHTLVGEHLYSHVGSADDAMDSQSGLHIGPGGVWAQAGSLHMALLSEVAMAPPAGLRHRPAADVHDVLQGGRDEGAGSVLFLHAARYALAFPGCESIVVAAPLPGWAV
jgi:23S rRNA-/tRNA-specific pseudouridylate synthase